MKKRALAKVPFTVFFVFIVLSVYIPKQEVKPKVVATAVKIVMTMLRIFPQMFLFSMCVFGFNGW